MKRNQFKKILINQAKMPIFLDRKFRLKPNQVVVAKFRLGNLNEFSNDRQVILVPNPNSESSAFLGRSFSFTQRTVCECVVEYRGNNGDDTSRQETCVRIASAHRVWRTSRNMKSLNFFYTPTKNAY